MDGGARGCGKDVDRFDRRLRVVAEHLMQADVRDDPDDLHVRRGFLERQAIGILRVGAREGTQNLAVESAGFHLARIDAQFGNRCAASLAVVSFGQQNGLAKIIFVLNPVQLDLEADQLVLRDAAFLHQEMQGIRYVLNVDAGFFLKVI